MAIDRTYTYQLFALVLLILLISGCESRQDADARKEVDSVQSAEQVEQSGSWWQLQMDQFKESVGQLPVENLKSTGRRHGGGTFAWAEGEMDPLMGDSFVLESASAMPLTQEQKLYFGVEGKLDLAPESRGGERRIWFLPRNQVTQDYQVFLNERDRMPHDLDELLSVTHPPETWKDKPEDEINRALLPYFDWHSGEFIDIQVESDEATSGDRYLQKLTDEQRKKWFELTGGSVRERRGETVDLMNKETWYSKLYGRNGEVLEAHIYHMTPIEKLH